MDVKKIIDLLPAAAEWWATHGYPTYPISALPDDAPSKGHGSCVNDFKTINRRVKEIARDEDRPSPLLDVAQHPEIEQGF